MLRLQAELKLQEAKEKIKKIEENEQKQAEAQQNLQNLQKDIQKVEETVANAVTQQTNYEEELMKRMSSVKDTDFEGSTAEMAEQAEKARKAWDDELNKVYKLLMSELSGEQKAKLQNSEREWIKNIEKEIERLKKEKLKLANCVLRAPKINRANTTIEIPATISPDCNSGTAFKVKIAVIPKGI